MMASSTAAVPGQHAQPQHNLFTSHGQAWQLRWLDPRQLLHSQSTSLAKLSRQCGPALIACLPVMARSGSTGLLSASDSSAVMMVQPAEGPSLGVAPAGRQK